MARKIDLQDRLNCPLSYTDETPHLKCEAGNIICDGTLYNICMGCGNDDIYFYAKYVKENGDES